MRQRPNRHIGSVRDHHLARTAARRRKQRQNTVLARISTVPSQRSTAKVRSRKAYLEQVATDKREGRESRKVCMDLYREDRRKRAERAKA